MKHYWLMVVSCLLFATTASAQASSYAGGDGTREHPFLISHAEHLAKLADDVATTPNFSRGRYFKLTQDIVINSDVMAQGSSKLTTGTAFPKTPMIGTVASETSYAAFQGTLDGDGHAICGFYQQETALYDVLRWIKKKCPNVRHFVRHYDIKRKPCPKYYVDNTEDWKTLKNYVEKIILKVR